MKGFKTPDFLARLLFSVSFALFVSGLQSYAQTPVKESPVITLTAESWQSFHQHDGVDFSGQLNQCAEKPIATIKIINQTPIRKEVRMGVLNGSKRLGNQVIVLLPAQEVVVDCSGVAGAPPLFLVDGITIRIETQVIQSN
jgi:hypothetical protein